ncbi:MAG: molybdate ABC transporter substrate-binding protein [Pontiella sp.]
MTLTIRILSLIFSLNIMTSFAALNAPLRLFAAAGTAASMKEIAREFTLETGIPVWFNFSNSGILAKQISAGAEFDLYISANEKWMDYVKQQHLIHAGSRFVLLQNELVIIVPKGHSPDINLSAPNVERFAIGDKATPIGIYAKQAFTELGCWELLKPKLCVADTVSKVLNYVALEEADAGIVFRSIAFCSSNQVDIACAVPAALHDSIRFPIATATDPRKGTEKFLQFVQSSKARDIFTKYGWPKEPVQQ